MELEEISAYDFSLEEAENIPNPMEARRKLAAELEQRGLQLIDEYRSYLREIQNDRRQDNEPSRLFPGKLNKNCLNCIGERISYIRQARGINRSDVASQAGIDRVNFIRIENGEGIPKKSTLMKILRVLDITPYEMFFPYDFEEWKAKDALFLFSAPRDIFKVRDNILNQLKGSFCYYQNGKEVRLPTRYYNILMDSVETAFNVLELLPHDK